MANVATAVSTQTPPIDTDILEKQFALLDHSQKLILVIIIAIFLSYYATDVQKSQVECLMMHPNTNICNDFLDLFPIRLLSSMFVLVALSYFYVLSEQSLCSAQNSCRQIRSASYNHMASLLVLIAAIIRMVDLLVVWKEERNSSLPSNTTEAHSTK